MPDRDELVRRCIRAGIDVETLHVDVCPQIHQLFGRPQTTFARAERAAQTIQIPIYASLSDLQVRRIAAKVRPIVQSLDPELSPVRELSRQWHSHWNPCQNLSPIWRSFVAAALEGGLVFVTSCILVSQGKLSAMGVLLAAALGGSLGDQVYFYALRGRLSKWLGRVRSVAERQVKFVGRIRRHSTRMILTSRFLAGLRIAIPSACAYADVPPLKCTLLSLCSGFAWSTTLPKLSPGWGSEAGPDR